MSLPSQISSLQESFKSTWSEALNARGELCSTAIGRAHMGNVSTIENQANHQTVRLLESSYIARTISGQALVGQLPD